MLLISGRQQTETKEKSLPKSKDLQKHRQCMDSILLKKVSPPSTMNDSYIHWEGQDHISLSIPYPTTIWLLVYMWKADVWATPPYNGKFWGPYESLLSLWEFKRIQYPLNLLFMSLLTCLFFDSPCNSQRNVFHARSKQRCPAFCYYIRTESKLHPTIALIIFSSL